MFYQSPGNSKEKEIEEDGIKFKSMPEKEMLQKPFGTAQKEYDEFVSFNGRMFPMRRSLQFAAQFTACDRRAICLSEQVYVAAAWREAHRLARPTFILRSDAPAGLALSCGAAAFRHQGEVREGDISWRRREQGLFKAKKYLDIARYNVGDLYATKELYEHWKAYLRF